MIAQATIIEKLQAALVGQTDLVAVYLFGSVAQGNVHARSDVDIALLFAEHLTPAEIFASTLAIGARLETQLPVPVDVIALNRAAPFLCFQVIKTGQLVLEYDRTARALFQMRAMNRYYDAKPYLDYQQAAMIRRIRAKGLGHGYQGDRNALTEVRKLRAPLVSTPASTPQ